MRLQVLIGSTPESVRRSAIRLRLSGYKRVASGASVRYTVLAKGSAEPRHAIIELTGDADELKNREAKVQCTCRYFLETLRPSLLRTQSLLNVEDTREARTLTRTTKRLGLCKHLVFAGLLIVRGALDKKEDADDEKKAATPAKQEVPARFRI